MRSPFRFDRKVGKHPWQYMVQCALAGIVTMAFLSQLGLLTHRGLVAALGATTFMVFTMPHRASSGPKYVVGGYVMGSLAGVVCYHCFVPPDGLIPISSVFILGAIAVATASLLMVTTNTEHAPAAGLALGLPDHSLCARLRMLPVGGQVSA